MVIVVEGLQNWPLYPHTLMYFHGTWIQWSLGRVTHVTSTDLGSKVIYGSMTFDSSFLGEKKGSLYPHTLTYFHRTWIQLFLGRVTPYLNKSWVKGHLGVIDLLVKFLKKKSHCIHILSCITMEVGLILRWLQKYVIRKAGETRGSRTALYCFTHSQV